jgi:parallel beta-helix repeat protein
MTMLKRVLCISVAALLLFFSANNSLLWSRFNVLSKAMCAPSGAIPIGINQTLTDFSTETSLNFTYTLTSRMDVWIVMNPSTDVDYDLYANWDGTIPTVDDYDNAPLYGIGEWEDCYMYNLSPGIYYFMVAYYEGTGTFNVTLTGWSRFPVHDLDSDLDYTTIQGAINALETLDGNTIFVEEGIYYENVVVNKSLSLVGEGAEFTTINAANSSDNAVSIIVSHVNVSGFNMTGATGWYPSASGIYLRYVYDVSISHNYVTNNTYGICMDGSNNNTVENNSVTANYFGINLQAGNRYNNITENSSWANTYYGIVLWAGSNNNSITRNIIFGNDPGITLGYSDHNIIACNSISWNSMGIEIQQVSNNNTIYHNNIVDNDIQAGGYHISESTNMWDYGYPYGGNYWSDYNGTDLCSGLNQNLTGCDGIGDITYTIDANNTDHYPLVGMFSDFVATPEFHVQTVCNSTISDFQFDGTAINFNLSGQNGTTGFCRICIPTELINGTYKVFVNGTEVSYILLPFSNATHSYLYFTYGLSTKEVLIVPEFPTLIIPPILMMATFVATIVYKRKRLI